MSLSTVEISAYVAALALAGSKLLTAAKPLWDKLPRPVAVALPVVVADLPLVAGYFGLVQTTGDLTLAVVTSVALLLPGLAEAEKQA